MKFSIKNGNPEKQRSACIVVGVFESRKLTEAAQAMDETATGYISSILRSGDMEGKAGSTLVLHNVPGTLCERVLLVGLGKEQNLGDKGYHDAIRATFHWRFSQEQSGVLSPGFMQRLESSAYRIMVSFITEVLFLAEPHQQHTLTQRAGHVVQY